ncbi:MAG: hypothetical protein ABIB71_04455 [Candidatus Woesearchaeota archaeon]
MNILVVMPDEAYQNRLVGSIKEVTAAADKVCYISLNKTYNAVEIMFEEHGLKMEKFFFIDAVSSEFMPVKDTGNCSFSKSVKDLPGLTSDIKSLLKKMEFDTIIFDSISTLFIYHPEEDIVRFCRDLMGYFSVTTAAAVFTTLQKDMKREALKELRMVVDKVIEIPSYMK